MRNKVSKTVSSIRSGAVHAYIVNVIYLYLSDGGAPVGSSYIVACRSSSWWSKMALLKTKLTAKKEIKFDSGKHIFKND